MAPRRRRRLTALLTTGLLLVAACSAGGMARTGEEIAEPDRVTTTTATTTTASTVPPPTTTTIAATTTSTSLLGTAGPDVAQADVRVPEGAGPFPAVVLVHGGGWIAGAPSVMTDLAVNLTEAGYLTVNTSYELATGEASYPGAVDDVACAVRLAQAHHDSSGTVTVLGHSAGAHLAALVALTGDRYGADCPHPGSGLPNRLVGLAGPYDVDRLGLLMLPFFGGGPEVEPEAWAAGNPQRLAGENAALSSLIMYGDDDALVDPGFAIDFHEALLAAGSDSTIEAVEGARHMDLRDPDWVADLIVIWLER